MLPIADVAARLDIPAADLIPYGRHMAKVPLDRLGRAGADGRLVLVSAITPTPAGEGKTTTSIGLSQGLARLGVRVALALREPSLGPVFGRKGGGTGGGRSRLEPSERINLHFTGDFHAITAAHNLLAAMVDNALNFGNPQGFDVRRRTWGRVLDVNDRALRDVVLGLGGTGGGVPRQSGFEITAASEVMALFCLASDHADLRARLGRLVVGRDTKNQPILASALGVEGALVALLADALHPNLVQSTEGVPAFVHGGPFANIAHGCNSVLATRMALRHADLVLTEAGFAFDLGGEKFFDIKCRLGGFDPAAVVLVATVRALRSHGGAADFNQPDLAAMERGLPNLARHLDAVARFGKPAMVVVNLHPSDTTEEIEALRRYGEARGVRVVPSAHFAQGGAGAEAAARELLGLLETPSGPAKRLYADEDPLLSKIEAIGRFYGASRVEVAPEAQASLKAFEAQGYGRLAVCMAKTQYSWSDDEKKGGLATDFPLRVRDVQLAAGAGFVVALTGDILRMPGLPRVPQALKIDFRDGAIVGVE